MTKQGRRVERPGGGGMADPALSSLCFSARTSFLYPNLCRMEADFPVIKPSPTPNNGAGELEGGNEEALKCS